MKGKLVMTVEEGQDRKAWLAMRDKGIGGSDISSIMGQNPWKGAYGLWLEKTKQVEPEDLSDNDAVHFGNVLEQIVADEFSARTGKKVRKCGTLQDEEYPFMLANIDRDVVGENAGLECKTARSDSEWKDDEVPDHYYLQCQWYMMVTGCEKWYIACLVAGSKFIWKEIPRNEEQIEAMRQAAVQFWTVNVQQMIAPSVDGIKGTTENIKSKYKQSDPNTAVELPGRFASIIKNYNELLVTQKLVEEQIAAYQNEIKVVMGNAEEARFNGKVVATWKSQKGRVSFDTKKFKADCPDIYAKYSKTGEGSRPFKLK